MTREEADYMKKDDAEQVERIKVSDLDIIVTMVDGKPYYEIKYKKIGDDHYNVGYSSYNLDFVLTWKDECFAVVGGAGWIPVSERLPEGDSGDYPINMVALDTGEVCIGVYRHDSKDWWTRMNEGETLYSTDHVVVAWMPLPEPYRESEVEDGEV